MAAPGSAGMSVREHVVAELHKIRADVTGVCGSVVATCDGFPVADDAPGLEPAEIAALVATTRALASRATQATARGQFREVVTRGSDGYLAVYAAGQHAVVAVIGTTDLNVGMLRVRARATLERIAAISSELAGSGDEPSRGPSPVRGPETSETDTDQKLPVRIPGRRPVRRLG